MGNISGWTEAILLVLAFLSVFGVMIAALNVQYDKTFNIGLTDNETEQLFVDYQDTATGEITGGEVEFDADEGISLKSSYGIMTDAANIIWSFLTGGFIENLANNLNLGVSGLIIARALRILYVLSLVFAILYALFKIVV